MLYGTTGPVQEATVPQLKAKVLLGSNRTVPRSLFAEGGWLPTSPANRSTQGVLGDRGNNGSSSTAGVFQATGK